MGGVGILESAQQGRELIFGDAAETEGIPEDGRIGATTELNALEAVLNAEEVPEGQVHGLAAGPTGVDQGIVDVEEEEGHELPLLRVSPSPWVSLWPSPPPSPQPGRTRRPSRRRERDPSPPAKRQPGPPCCRSVSCRCARRGPGPAGPL